jgi:hypothetical protein
VHASSAVQWESSIHPTQFRALAFFPTRREAQEEIEGGKKRKTFTVANSKARRCLLREKTRQSRIEISLGTGFGMFLNTQNNTSYY